MKYWYLYDKERNKPHTMLPYEDQKEFERAVISALRKPDTVYAQFPSAFSAHYAGVMEIEGFVSDDTVIHTSLEGLLKSVMEGK